MIRAWIDGDPPILKIRVTSKGDLRGRRQTIGVASDIDEACDIVRIWLETFSRGSDEAEPGSRRAS